MPDVVLDTSIIVDYSKKKQAAHAALSEVRRPDRLVTHFVGVTESIAGARNRDDLRKLLGLLGGLKVLMPAHDDFETCIALLREHHLSHKIGWPDCLIAATCLRLRLPIMTVNMRHLGIIDGLKVIRPY